MQPDAIKRVHMFLLNKTLRLALCLVSSFFRCAYFFGNAIIVTFLLDKANECSHSCVDAVIQVFAGFGSASFAKSGIRSATQLACTAGPGGRTKNLLVTLMPFSRGRCGSRAGGHCQTLTPSRRARATPKSLARSWDEHSAGAAHRDRLWVMLCHR